MKSDRIKTSIGYSTKEEQLNSLLNVYSNNVSWYHEQWKKLIYWGVI